MKLTFDQFMASRKNKQITTQELQKVIQITLTVPESSQWIQIIEVGSVDQWAKKLTEYKNERIQKEQAQRQKEEEA